MQVFCLLQEILYHCNGTGFPTPNRKLGIRLTSASNTRKQIKTKHKKYVDDLMVAELVDLKEKLETDKENTLEKPVLFIAELTRY